MDFKKVFQNMRNKEENEQQSTRKAFLKSGSLSIFVGLLLNISKPRIDPKAFRWFLVVAS